MEPPNQRFDPWCCPHSGSHLRRFLPIPETPEEEELIAAYDWVAMFSVDDVEEAKVRLMSGPTPENWDWVRNTENRCSERDHAHDDRKEVAGCRHPGWDSCVKCEDPNFHWHHWLKLDGSQPLACHFGPGELAQCYCGKKMYGTGTDLLTESPEAE